MRKAFYLAVKDFQLEMRQHTVFAPLLFLGLLLLFLGSYGGKALGLPPDKTVLYGLWATMIYTSLLLISRTLSEEANGGCWDGLLLCPVPYATLFFGKLIYGVAVLGILESILFPAAVFFGGLRLYSPLLFGLTIFLSAIGIMAVGLVFALAGLKTESGPTSVPVVTLPFLIPLLMLSIGGMAALFNHHAPWAEIGHILLYDVVFSAAAVFLFSPEGL